MSETTESCITQELIEAYHAGDGEAAMVLQMRGAALVPGLRLGDCATAAIVRFYCDTDLGGDVTTWELYVQGLHRENRVRRGPDANELAARSHIQMEE